MVASPPRGHNRILEMEATEMVRVEKGLISRMTLELASSAPARAFVTAPDRILGLMGWFRASSITGVRERDVIEYWNDSSRNLNQFVQHNPVRRPTFIGSTVGSGQAALAFDGAATAFESELLASRLRDLKTVTVVSVVRAGQSAKRQTVLGCYNTNRSRSVIEFGFDEASRISIRGSNQPISSQDRALASVGPGGSGSLAIYSMVVTPNSVIVHENGQRRIVAQAQEVDLASAAICTIGESRLGNASRDLLAGDISEVLVYDHALTVPEQVSVERYLGQLYRIPVHRGP